MAVFREAPYPGFNFIVDLGEGVDAGFAEVGGIGFATDVIEYRVGGDKSNSVRKLAGLTRYDDITLRRGIAGSLNLYNWLREISDGGQGGTRSVTISLLSEDHGQVVLTWKLLRARIIRQVMGPLDAKAGTIAIEEITLAYERLELE